jgi:hypothetical protein
MARRLRIRLTAARRSRKKPRQLENTVTDIANRPAPVRRSLFNLIDTLIASREVTDQPGPAGENRPSDGPTEGDQQKPPRRPKSPGSR